MDKRRSFYKALAKRAELQVFDKLDSSRGGWEEAATDLVQSLGKKYRLHFDEEALDLFVLLTGGDTRTIKSELEKLDLFLGEKERRVTLEDVRTLVPISRAGVIFELGNALAARDLERALALVRRLLDQGEKAIGILLVAIIPTVRNLLLAKDLMQRHRLPRPGAPYFFISTLNRLPAEATAHLPRKKDGSINGYAFGIAAMQAHRFETERLIAGLEACLTANLQIVTTQLDHELILNQVVMKLLRCLLTTTSAAPMSRRLGRRYSVSFVCLRAIGPTQGISQRTPLNAFTIAMIRTIRKPTCTSAETRAQRPARRWPRPGMAREFHA